MLPGVMIFLLSNLDLDGQKTAFRSAIRECLKTS